MARNHVGSGVRVSITEVWWAQPAHCHHRPGRARPSSHHSVGSSLRPPELLQIRPTRLLGRIGARIRPISRMLHTSPYATSWGYLNQVNSWYCRFFAEDINEIEISAPHSGGKCFFSSLLEGRRLGFPGEIGFLRTRSTCAPCSVPSSTRRLRNATRARCRWEECGGDRLVVSQWAKRCRPQNRPG